VRQTRVLASAGLHRGALLAHFSFSSLVKHDYAFQPRLYLVNVSAQFFLGDLTIILNNAALKVRVLPVPGWRFLINELNANARLRFARLVLSALNIPALWGYS
jgi:hypothetical protein